MCHCVSASGEIAKCVMLSPQIFLSFIRSGRQIRLAIARWPVPAGDESAQLFGHLTIDGAAAHGGKQGQAGHKRPAGAWCLQNAAVAALFAQLEGFAPLEQRRHGGNQRLRLHGRKQVGKELRSHGLICSGASFTG